MEALLTTDRYIHGTASSENRLYVVGGHIQDQGGGKWSTEWTEIKPDGRLKPWRQSAPLGVARFLAAVTACQGHLFILGGYNGEYLASVEAAEIQEDGSLDRWSPTIPLSRAKEGSAAVALNGAIYLLGGSRSGICLREVEYARVNPQGGLGYWVSP